MSITPQSKAAGVGSAVRNVQFQPTAVVIPRKILLIGTFNPALTSVVPDQKIQVFSAEDAGDKLGFGYMLHRMVKAAFAGGKGIETWVIPQDEAIGGSAATGAIDFATTTVEAGTIYLYVAGELISVNVASTDTATTIAAAVVSAINSTRNCPLSAAVNVGDDTIVDLTAKSQGGFWGNSITINFNLNPGESFPGGVSAIVTDMAGGAGTPDISTALDSLGTGDAANEDFFTDISHGYGQVTSTLDAISQYVGEGNGFTGLYTKTIARPFRALTGDTVADTAGLTALLALADGRKLDRANGVIAAPGSPMHPSEIAAQSISIAARINNTRAEESYNSQVIEGIIPGAVADRWTSEYINRDNAVRGGVSTTFVENGALTIQNLVTFYRPDNVPEDSNGYRSMRNISILQNILANIKLNFSQEKWKGVSIVADLTRVSSAVDKEKARDVDSVIDDLVALSNSFEAQAWVYTASFTNEGLTKPGAVVIRNGASGFDSKLPIILSGEGGIFDTVVEFDTSIAVLL